MDTSSILSKPHAYVFTDGSCTRTGLGAWAGLIVVPGIEVHPLYGVASYTTINRCELAPIIDSLRYIRRTFGKGKPGLRLTLISDSETTIKTIGGANKANANLDLWAAYNEVSQGFNITPIWRQRNTHPYMTFVDNLCYAVRDCMKLPAKNLTGITPSANLDLKELADV